MARVVPAPEELRYLPEPLNEGEQHVLRALEQLDDQWLVYVQPRLELDQPDFVVVHPQLGVTAIEVKDWSAGAYRQTPNGRIEHRERDTWQPTAEAPRYQAHRYRDAIFSRFFADVNMRAEEFASVRGVVIMVRHTTEQARALLRIPRVLAKAEQRIGVWGLRDLMERPMVVLTGTERPRARPVPQGNLDRLRRHLAEPDALRDSKVPLELSPAAENIERNPSNAKMRRVRGPAGSGKSVGLAARAARLSAEGKDVLVLTFNGTLPHYLHPIVARRCLEIDGRIQRITVTHLHGFCKRVCDDARLHDFEPVSAQLPGIVDEHDEVVERAADVYRSGVSGAPTFDAILVDEGQDFTLRWWNFLREHVLRSGGEMLLVADPAQDVYGKRAWTDEEVMRGAGFRGSWTEVDGSFRLPPDLVPVVAEFARRHLREASGQLALPLAVTPAAGTAATEREWVDVVRRDCGQQLGRAVVRLLEAHPDLNPGDVVFLAPSHQIGLEAVDTIAAAGFDVQHIFATSHTERRRRKQRFLPHEAGVKGCTYHSFKGWESRAVVMAVMATKDAHRLAYVGLTRVRGRAGTASYITVVNADPRLRQFGPLFRAS